MMYTHLSKCTLLPIFMLYLVNYKCLASKLFLCVGFQLWRKSQIRQFPLWPVTSWLHTVLVRIISSCLSRRGNEGIFQNISCTSSNLQSQMCFSVPSTGFRYQISLLTRWTCFQILTSFDNICGNACINSVSRNVFFKWMKNIQKDYFVCFILTRKRGLEVSWKQELAPHVRGPLKGSDLWHTSAKTHGKGGRNEALFSVLFLWSQLSGRLWFMAQYRNVRRVPPGGGPRRHTKEGVDRRRGVVSVAEHSFQFHFTELIREHHFESVSESLRRKNQQVITGGVGGGCSVGSCYIYSVHSYEA